MAEVAASREKAWWFAVAGATSAALASTLPLLTMFSGIGPLSWRTAAVVCFGPAGLLTITGLALCLIARWQAGRDDLETRRIANRGLVLVAVSVLLFVIVGYLFLVVAFLVQNTD